MQKRALNGGWRTGLSQKYKERVREQSMKTSYRILAENQKVNNDTWITGLNNNDVIIGPSGAGKTRGYVIPNILQAEESIIVADTKGNLSSMLIRRMRKRGYSCRTLDFTDGYSTVGYNPFDYIRYNEKEDSYSAADIKTIAAAMVPIESREPFWDYAARMYLESMIAYVLECLPKEEHTLMAVHRCK